MKLCFYSILCEYLHFYIELFKRISNAFCFFSVCSVKYDALCQRQFRWVVQCDSRAFTILFPWIGTRLSSTPSMFLSAKSATDFCSKWLKVKSIAVKVFALKVGNISRFTCTRWWCVYIYQATIGPIWTNPLRNRTEQNGNVIWFVLIVWPQWQSLSL